MRSKVELVGGMKTRSVLAALTLFFLVGFMTLPGQASAAALAPDSFANLAKKVGPAVVNISTEHNVKSSEFQFRGPMGKNDQFEDFFKKFFGDQVPREYKQRGLGSGFIISKDGLVITNNHVVEKADVIKVKLSNGESHDAEVVGRDPKTDIALIKIKGGGSFPFLPLGDSDKIQVGDWVLAVGNPFGLESTVTAGIISAKQRNIGAGPYDDFLQTDAPINPGNSGGPLVDLDGEVIGINTAIVASGQGIGFAIPSNMANNIIAQLRDSGKVVRGWLGVMIQRITPELEKSFNLKDDQGALVADVPEDSPAAKAGIKRGDVIVEFNGKAIKEWSDLPSMVANTKVGETVPVKVMRDGKEKVFDVKIGELKEEMTAAAGEERHEEAKLGMTVEEITPDVAARLGIEKEEGVIVTRVDENSPAAEAGLRPGDIIKEIQREPVKDMDSYNNLINKLEKGNALILIKRGGSTFFVTLELK